MEWYIPISLLPGIALLILSTSHFIVALNEEVKILKSENTIKNKVITRKIEQLKRLSYAISGLYISVLFLTLVGFLTWFTIASFLIIPILLIGLASMTISVVLLVIYSIKAISIRTIHLTNKK